MTLTVDRNNMAAPMDKSMQKENDEKPAPRNGLSSGLGLLALGSFFVGFTFFGAAMGMRMTYKKNARKASLLKELMKETKVKNVMFAMKALGYGTLLSVTGCSALFFTVWKVSGIKSIPELESTLQAAIPYRVKKPEEQKGRTEFESFTDFFEYLAEQKKGEDWTTPSNESSKGIDSNS